MRKAVLALAVVTALAVAIMLGCSGGGSVSPPPVNNSSGSLVVLGTDAPLCNVFSFTVTISGLTLTPQGGGTPVSALSQGQPITVDFVRLMGFNAMLNLASVPAGTYSQMTLTLSSAQVTVMDVTQTPPVPVSINTSLQNAQVVINLDPALTVAANGTASLLVDFHLFRSVTMTQGGATVNPVMTVAEMSHSAEDGWGRLDDLHGVVQSVSTTASGSFIGSFTLQTRGGFGRVFTINVTSNTEFEGVTNGLSGLAAGDFVEIDAYVGTSGDIVAREVEKVATEEGSGTAFFEGLVVYITPHATPNPTQFVLFVREENPDVSDSIPLRSALTVNLSDTTAFKIIRPGINEANLTFDASNLGVGQAVVVHGPFHTGAPNTLDADGVALRPQAVRGQYSPPLLGVGSDGKTGGFDLVPCSDLFRGQAIHVFTFADTEFYGISDLNGLNTMTAVHAKGLLFSEPGPTTVNGITVTGPSMVMEARRVHQRSMGD